MDADINYILQRSFSSLRGGGSEPFLRNRTFYLVYVDGVALPSNNAQIIKKGFELLSDGVVLWTFGAQFTSSRLAGGLACSHPLQQPFRGNWELFVYQSFLNCSTQRLRRRRWFWLGELLTSSVVLPHLVPSSRIVGCNEMDYEGFLWHQHVLPLLRSPDFAIPPLKWHPFMKHASLIKLSYGIYWRESRRYRDSGNSGTHNIPGKFTIHQANRM